MRSGARKDTSDDHPTDQQTTHPTDHPIPFDLSPRPLLPPPRPPYRWWLPLPYLMMVTFALRWSSIYSTEDAVGALAVALGAWLLGLCSYRAAKSRYTPWMTGIFYCFACSVYTPFGRYETRELVANLGPIVAWLIAVAPREYGVGYKQISLSRLRKEWSLAGVAVGVGAVLHPFSLAAIAGLISFSNSYYRRQRRTPTGQAIPSLLIGVAIPLVAAAVYWLLAGTTDPLEMRRFFHFSGWGWQLLYFGQYLLYFLPLLAFTFVSMFGNLLSSSRPDFGALLPGHAYVLFWVILLFGGGTTAPLVLMHPVLTLQCAEMASMGGPSGYRQKHGFTLLLVIAAALGVGYLHVG